MNLTLLDVQDLRVYYRTEAGDIHAVDGVSFIVKQGEIFGLVGESACGKSTISRAILRLVEPPGYIDHGTVYFDNLDLYSLDEESLRKLRWSRMSYVPQSAMNALNPVMKIKDQIADAITTHQEVPEDEIVTMARQVLNIMNLPPDVIDMYPHELSGGMRLRSVIAMALVLNPDLIVMDEPTTALDVVIQRAVLEEILRIKDQLGISIVFITHSMAVIAEIADRVAVMYAGRIAEIAPVQDIYGDPFHPYTNGLIEAIPGLGSKKKIKGLPGLPPNLLNPPIGCRFYPRCPQAMENCKTESPTLIKAAPDRLVACHLYGGLEHD